MLNKSANRWVFILGGACAIAWPLLSEVAFYGLYPVLAGSVGRPAPGGPEALMSSLAGAGQRPAVLALEWSRVAVQFLLLPFLLAVYRLLCERDQVDLGLLALCTGLVGLVLALLSQIFNPALSHLLGQAYLDASAPEEAASIMAFGTTLLRGRAGLNQALCLIYQASVALFSLALLRSRTWRGWGWVGLAGALLALPAKLPFGWQAPTNFVWTGLAYFVWPIALGVCLLRVRESSSAVGIDSACIGRDNLH
jgi:hypothetical protein